VTEPWTPGMAIAEGLWTDAATWHEDDED